MPPEMRIITALFLLVVPASISQSTYLNFEKNDESYIQANIELNSLYKNLMMELSEENQEKLRNAERAWLEYLDLANDCEKNINTQAWRAGRTELTWQRVDNLKRMLFYLSPEPDLVPSIRNFKLLKENLRPLENESYDTAEMWDDVLLFRDTGQRIHLFKSESLKQYTSNGDIYWECEYEKLLNANSVRLEWLIPNKVFVIYLPTYPIGNGVHASTFIHIYMVKGKYLFRLYCGKEGGSGKAGHYGAGGETAFKYDEKSDCIIKQSKRYIYAPEEVLKNNPLAYFPPLAQDMFLETFIEQRFLFNQHKLERVPEEITFVKLDGRSLTVKDIARGLLMDRGNDLSAPAAPEPNAEDVTAKIKELMELNGFSGPDTMCKGKVLTGKR